MFVFPPVSNQVSLSFYRIYLTKSLSKFGQGILQTAMQNWLPCCCQQQYPSTFQFMHLWRGHYGEGTIERALWRGHYREGTMERAL